MNELESVDIFCMSEHPKRIRSHEVTVSQVYEDTYEALPHQTATCWILQDIP